MLGIFLDTETNGLNFSVHKILQIAFKIVDLADGSIRAEYDSLVYQPYEVWQQSDVNSLKVTGFKWNMIKQGRSKEKISKQIIEIFNMHQISKENSVFICQNPSFDRVFFSELISSETQELFKWPYHWLDLASMHWSRSLLESDRKKALFPWEIGFSKDLIASHFHLPSETKPHRALNGVNHLLLCYEAVVGFPFKKHL